MKFLTILNHFRPVQIIKFVQEAREHSLPVNRNLLQYEETKDMVKPILNI